MSSGRISRRKVELSDSCLMVFDALTHIREDSRGF